MRKMMVPIRPACVMGISVYSAGEAFFNYHRTPQAMIPGIEDLVEALKQDINSLTSLTKLQAAIASLPQPADEPMDPQQAQQTMTRNAEEASLIQSIHEVPVAIVLTVDPKGKVVAGFATAEEYSTENVKFATTAVAVSLADSPTVAYLKDVIRNVGTTTN